MIDEKRCRSCGAVIVWARTDSGKLMPVDAEPSSEGRLVLTRFDSRWLVSVKGEARPGEVRHRPHFVTCPDAENWRRR